MKFGEKVRKLRRERKLTQSELAAKIGVSGRSVASYEAGISYPRYRETYDALAAVLGVDVNDLRREDEELPEDVSQWFGSPGQRRAYAILAEVRLFFADEEISFVDKLALLTEIQLLFLDSVRRKKRRPR